MKIRFLRKWNRFRRGDVEVCVFPLAAWLTSHGFAVEVPE